MKAGRMYRLDKYSIETPEIAYHVSKMKVSGEPFTFDASKQISKILHSLIFSLCSTLNFHREAIFHSKNSDLIYKWISDPACDSLWLDWFELDKWQNCVEYFRRREREKKTFQIDVTFNLNWWLFFVIYHRPN